MSCDDCTVPPDDPPEVYTAWKPDPQLVPAVLAASRPIRTLTSKADKCWAVAGLHCQPMTAEDIRDRLKCSLRLVRTLLSDPMTKVFILYHAEVAAFREELGLTAHELRTATLTAKAAMAEAERFKEQRDRLIDMVATGEPIKLCRKGLHVMDKYGTYVHPKTGKAACRACRHDAVRRHRAGNNRQLQVSDARAGGTLDICAPDENEPPDAATPACRRTPVPAA